MNNPIILLTNDDGIRASGLRALVEIARPFGRLVVVAPEEVQSAQSHAITGKMPLRLRSVADYCGVEAWACSGTPVDCVKIAMSELLGGAPDVVLSGINHGTNSSSSVIYSGTVAAAQEGALYGSVAIAYSLLDFSADADFTPCIETGRRILEKMLHNNIRNDIVLNVNFPVCKEFAGIKVTRLANGRWREYYIKRQDPNGNNYYWLTGHFENCEPDAQDTDEWALERRYVSITPLGADMTCYKSLPLLDDCNFTL